MRQLSFEYELENIKCLNTYCAKNIIELLVHLEYTQNSSQYVVYIYE